MNLFQIGLGRFRIGLPKFGSMDQAGHRRLNQPWLFADQFSCAIKPMFANLVLIVERSKITLRPAFLATGIKAGVTTAPSTPPLINAAERAAELPI